METNYPIPSQAQIKKWGRMTSAKFRREEKLFLVEGVKVVEELLDSTWPVEAILLMTGKKKYWEEIIAKTSPNIPCYELSAVQWHKISQDKEPEGIMAVVSTVPEPSWDDFLASASGNILILHEINNPGNLGAIMRSALWFGFNNVILGAGSVDYTNPKVVRTSMGSLFHLNLISEVMLKKALPEIKKSYCLVSSNVYGGRTPHIMQKNTALLLGNESHGLPVDLLDLADEQWNIQGNGKVDSLSLPQAAAIMMYECVKKG